MTKPFIVLVDLDNVIADQTAGFYNALADQYSEIKPPPRDSLKEFDFEQNFPDEHHKQIKSLRLRESFFRGLPLVSGAKEGLARLADLVDHVRIVTAPTWEWQHCVPEKYAWVEEHLGRDWSEKIILTRDKTFVRGDILIDDNPSVTGICTPTWTHVLYDQPYNRAVNDMPRVTWAKIDSFIKEWKEKTETDGV